MIRYLFREGFRNIWKNKFMALASVGVLLSCLVLCGAAFLVYININAGFKWAYSQNAMIAWVADGTDATATAAVGDAIRALPNVSTVTFVSKEELLERKFKGLLSDPATYDAMVANNPLPDSYEITITDLAAFDQTLSAIQAVPGVSSVSSSATVAQMLLSVRQTVFLAGGWVVVLLFLVSLFIIVNTIKLTVYSRRLEIFIMKSVGATRAFIRTPFIIEGVVLGLVSGAAALFVLAGLYGLLGGRLVNGLFTMVPFIQVWWQVLLGFLGLGAVIGALGSAISTGKYLKEERANADE